MLLKYFIQSYGAILTDPKYKWPINEKIVVNYYHYSWYLDKAIQYFEENTCLKFQRSYHYILYGHGIHITYSYSDGCYVDHYGRKENNVANRIFLNAHCAYDVTKIQALILQVLGLLPEQNRIDRDQYVHIDKDNAFPDRLSYFNVNSNLNTSTYGTIYDYGSSMQDGGHAYSKNGHEVIKAINNHSKYYQKMMGQKYMIGFYEYKLLNLHYCNHSCAGKSKPECWWSGYQNPNQCGKCLCPFPLRGDICRDLPPNKNIYLQQHYILYFSYEMFEVRSAHYVYWFLEAPGNYRVMISVGYLSLYNYSPCATKTDMLEFKYKKDKGVMGLCFCGYNYEAYEFESEDRLVIGIYRGDYFGNYIQFWAKAIK
uniref:Metalloendopeptidase n=1 Tax=Parastrongyloides trichosuri TaxID=131310 RepID=A0A0N4ZHW3_PARTI